MTEDNAARAVEVVYQSARARIVELYGEASNEVRMWDGLIETGLFRDAVGDLLHAMGAA